MLSVETGSGGGSGLVLSEGHCNRSAVFCLCSNTTMKERPRKKAPIEKEELHVAPGER